MIARLLPYVIVLLLVFSPLAGFTAPVTSPLAPGLNLVGVTAELATGNSTAFPLLISWKSSGVTAVEVYDAVSGKMLRAELDGGGNPSGIDFPLTENHALYVYSTQKVTLLLGDSAPCGPLDLTAGLNLAAYACFPADYRASDFITSVGLANITSLSRLDTSSGRWQTAAVDAGAIVGEDFPLAAGEGYVIHATAVTGWTAPLVLTPAGLTVQQGQPDVSLTVSIPFAAPAGGTSVGLASSDPALVAVAGQVTVPAGSSSVSVPLTVPDTGITAVQAVTITASSSGLANAQAAVLVHPKPTIDLSPLSTVTGLTFSYQLTVSLNETAPAGGFPVTLTAAPDGIVSVPSSLTIPAGASSAQVTVTALSTVGSATITATSPGRGFSGAQHGVTVKPTQPATYTPLVSRQLGVQVALATTPPPTTTYTPVTSREVGVQIGPVDTTPPSQTVGYGPLSSSPLGVMVTPLEPDPGQSVTYGPTASQPLGVTVGSTINSITPISGAIGASGIKVRALGVGLGGASAISFQPATGITIQPGTFAIGADGNPEVIIDIAANAPVTPRTVLVALSTGGYALPTDAGSNQFRVTLPTPEMYSIQPLRSMVGQSVTMTITGRYFGSASSVNFTPSSGITVNNPPTVSSDGTSITSTFTIAANAALGTRVVTVTTPGGTTGSVAGPTNSFTVTATTDPGVVHTAFSTGLGVMVEVPAASTDKDVTYGPTASQPLGVTVGSTITAIAPISGAIGENSLKIRALGIGLGDASAISFQPATGITIQPGTFAIGADGNPEVIIDIAADAPVTPRTVLVALSGGGYALPTDAGSNQFRVTLPTPEIQSVQPIRAMVGQVVAMTIMGSNFGSASSVDLTPATGITVTNPPTVNPGGTMITVTITLAADAPLGTRVVTVTTPGGTTSSAATPANSFTVTADQGTTYTPLLSPELGVMVTQNSGDGQVAVPYGPVSSLEVGVMVTPPPAPESQDVTYGPLVSTQLGVAVGGHFTGFSPFALEPGSSATFTLNGSGLDAVTTISIVPAANLTVTDWTPAGDGRSGTFTVTAGAGVTQGVRTIVPLVGSTALPPAAVGANILQIGYRPVANSITTTYPTSTVLATTGSTVTLTMNGVHLQGVTRVEILPADGITIDSVPTWFSDATGEHVSVTVIVAEGAAIGERLVRLSTPYGSTSDTRDVTNTLSIVVVVGSAEPAGAESKLVASSKSPAALGNDALSGARIFELTGLGSGRQDSGLLPVLQRLAPALTARLHTPVSTERAISAVVLPDASRDPPELFA